MRTEHRPKLEMGRQIGYLFGWPVIVGQVFGVESPETPTEEKGVGGCDGPQEPVNTSGAPSGGEQAPNSGSGEATDCVCPAGKAHTLACIAARVEAGCEHFETRYQEAKASAEAIDCAGMPSWAELHELYPDRSTPEWAKEQIERAERYRRGIEAEMALLAIENTTKIVGGA